MTDTILVTGATGNLGRSVVQALRTTGFRVKAASRHPETVPLAEHVEAVRMDYTDPSTVAPALANVKGVFLIAPPMDPEAPAKLKPIIEKAKTLGVEHIVFTSALGADQSEQSPLRIVERALIASGVNYTILRPNFFMENFSAGFVSPMIKSQGSIFLAAGEGKTSFISTQDIAEVAATAFAKKLFGKEYNLTGPDALDHTEVARIISRAIGKKITYQPLSEEAMLQGARQMGMPEGAVQYMRVLYAAVRAGYTAAVTSDVETVTGRKPMTFDAFARKNAAAWA
ncbi:MAG: SDR family oxidoreductase [bacterium]|nr:SDR family oxidoreductase [bacterium]